MTKKDFEIIQNKLYNLRYHYVDITDNNKKIRYDNIKEIDNDHLEDIHTLVKKLESIFNQNYDFDDGADRDEFLQDILRLLKMSEELPDYLSEDIVGSLEEVVPLHTIPGYFQNQQ